MAERELAAADAFFARIAGEPTLEAELDRRMAGPITPLITALAAWEEAPPEASHAAGRQRGERCTPGRAAGGRLARACAGSGADGTDAAWLLAQHADRANDARRGLAAARSRRPSTQRRRRSTPSRLARPIASPPWRASRRRYGEVRILASDGEAEFPLPLADPGRLEARRAAIGLPSVAAESRYLPMAISSRTGRIGAPCRSTNGRWCSRATSRSRPPSKPVHAPSTAVWAARPGDRRWGRLRALARERGVVIDQVEPELVDELASGRTHGGVIALVGAAARTRAGRAARRGGGGVAGRHARRHRGPVQLRPGGAGAVRGRHRRPRRAPHVGDGAGDGHARVGRRHRAVADGRGRVSRRGSRDRVVASACGWPVRSPTRTRWSCTRPT